MDEAADSLQMLQLFLQGDNERVHYRTVGTNSTKWCVLYIKQQDNKDNKV